MNIVFLDIDGVLRIGSKTEPLCVTELNRITQSTRSSIVVTSTWRRDPQIFDTLTQWGVTGSFLGATPDLSRQDNHILVGVERWTEIEKYLSMFPGKHSFVILDDDKDMGKYLPFLIQTNPSIGLTHDDGNRAIMIMQRQNQRHYRNSKISCVRLSKYLKSNRLAK